MNFRHLFFLAVGIFALGATLRAQTTIEQMAADPKLWPREVKLTQAAPIQLWENGRPSGSAQGTVGMTLKVKKVEAGRLTVETNSATGFGIVAPAATDILTRLPGAAPAPAGAGKFESMRTGVKMVRGKWVVTGETEIEQHDAKDGVSNAYKSIPQTGRLEYRAKYKYTGGKNSGITIYIMCDDADKTERGNAYLLVDGNDDKSHGQFIINRVTDDKTKDMKKFDCPPAGGQWIDFRATYDADTGTVEITRNGKVLGSWTDPSPLKEGKHFSIGTYMTHASFKDLEVHPLP